MLFHVTAAEYLTDFKPKRVVLGFGTYKFVDPSQVLYVMS